MHGHDWVFSSEVLKVFGNPADGDVISIKDGRDRMLGSAIWNSKSQIVARRFSHRRQDLDLDFFKRRIAQAAEYRDRRKVNPQLHRVVWSESDGLPGMILDRYGDQFVLQLTTLGMDQRKEILVDAIGEVLGGRNIIERSDAAVRRAEGLPQTSGVLRGEARQYGIRNLRREIFDRSFERAKNRILSRSNSSLSGRRRLRRGPARPRLLYQ